MHALAPHVCDLGSAIFSLQPHSEQNKTRPRSVLLRAAIAATRFMVWPFFGPSQIDLRASARAVFLYSKPIFWAELLTASSANCPKLGYVKPKKFGHLLQIITTCVRLPLMGQGRRQAAATDRALMAYMPGGDVYAIARKFGVSPSNLYRALRAKGIKFRRGNHK